MCLERTKRPPQQNITLIPDTHPHLPVQNPAVLAPKHLQVHGGTVLPHLDAAADFPRADDGLALVGVVGESDIVLGQQGGEEDADFFGAGFAGGDDGFGFLGFLVVGVLLEFEEEGEFFVGGGVVGVVGFFVGGGVVGGGGGGVGGAGCGQGGEVGAAGDAVDAG